MYTDHFGLDENPFIPTTRTPHPFASRELKEALAHFVFAHKNREAFFLLVGEVGTGKSTAISAILEALPRDRPVAVLRHTSLDARELLEEVVQRFGLEPPAHESKPLLLSRLEHFLAPSAADEPPAVLIIDEAHLLSQAALEEVRLLSNLREGDRPLLLICLVGQPELLNRLRQHRLRPLRQRIAVRYIVGALTKEETRDYIVHRLRAAGAAQPDRLFTLDAAEAVHELTGGLPREINVVASQAMLNSYLENASVISSQHVRSTKSDYGFEGLRVEEEPKSVEAPRREVPQSEVSPQASAPRKLPEKPTVTPTPPEPPQSSARRTTTDLPLQFHTVERRRAERARPAVRERPVLSTPADSREGGGKAFFFTIAVAALIVLGWVLYTRADIGRELASLPSPEAVAGYPAPVTTSIPGAPNELVELPEPMPPPTKTEPEPEIPVAAARREEPIRDSTMPVNPSLSLGAAIALPTRPAREAPSPPRPASVSAADRLELGTNLARRGRLDEAIAAYREAIAIDPNYGDALYNLGISLIETHRPDEAVAPLRKAVSLSPNDALAQRALGVALRQTGLLEEAAKVLGRAIALQPKDALALQHLASVLREAGQIEESIDATRRAIALKPEDPLLYQDLGFGLRAANRLEEAAGAFQKAIQLDGNLALAHYSLGVTFHEMGQPGEAQRELAEAKRLGYDPS